MKARTASAILACAWLLASCEDQGNPGDDNLLTGASLIVVVIVVIGVILFVRRRG